MSRIFNSHNACEDVMILLSLRCFLIMFSVRADFFFRFWCLVLVVYMVCSVMPQMYESWSNAFNGFVFTKEQSVLMNVRSLQGLRILYETQRTVDPY